MLRRLLCKLVVISVWSFTTFDLMEGCTCLEEYGELCDGCFNSWGGRFKCFEVNEFGRPVLDPEPELPPTQPMSDDEDQDEPVDESQGDDLESLAASTSELRPVASVSQAYRSPYPAAWSTDDQTLAGTRRVGIARDDPYGEYLKRMKTSKQCTGGPGAPPRFSLAGEAPGPGRTPGRRGQKKSHSFGGKINMSMLRSILQKMRIKFSV